MTVKDLINVIDDESWNEFMPHGFTKAIFSQIEHLIDDYNLLSSTGAIIKRAKEADAKPIQERIIEVARMIAHFHFPDKETVLTPWRVVNMHMASTLGGYNFYNEDYSQLLDLPQLHEQEGITSEIFCNPDAHVLEVNSKSGVYPLWIAHTFWALQREDTFTQEQDWELWKRVVENNLYVVCKTRMAEKITRRVLCGYNKEIRPNTVSYENLIDILKDEKKRNNLIKKLHKSATYGKEDNTMIEFEAVVGNPPYQESSNVNNRQDPIYHYFYDLSEDLSEVYTLISPARFLFNAGLTPTSWNKKMLNDEHLRIVYYNQDSASCFPNTDIKGGIAIILRNSNQKFGAIKNFIPNDVLRFIASKFSSLKESNLSRIIYGGRSDLKFNNQFLKEYPDSPKDRLTFIQIKRPAVKVLGPNEEYELKSSTFEALPYVFVNNVENPSDYYHLLGLEKSKRTWKYIAKKYMTPRYAENNNIGRYKVFIPKANGNGIFGESLSKTEIGLPNDSATSTFISIGAFKTKEEAINCSKYLRSKFLRCLLGILKITQDNPPAVWSYIPLQDFTPSSDIDWSKSISEIDAQLYAKYGLSKEEIKFIEEKVTPME